MSSDAIFVPVRDIDFPDPVVGVFFGVDIPASLPFYDVRTSDGFAQPKAHYGETLFSSERIAYKLGLRVGWFDGVMDTCMGSVQYYYDSRIPVSAESTAVQVRWVLSRYQALLDVYALAEKFHDNSDGGSVVYRPVFGYLANYGAGVVGTREDYRVVPFRGQAERFWLRHRQIMAKAER